MQSTRRIYRPNSSAASYEADLAAHEEKVQAREERQQATGKKLPGRPPKPPEPGPRDSDQVNLTDKESRIMPSGGSGFEQAYNAQAVVDLATHLVVGGHVTQASNDKQQFVPALDDLDQLPEEVGRVTKILADNGYFSASNVQAAIERKVEPMIALGRQKHNVPLADRLMQEGPESRPPEEATPVEKMAYRLSTPDGRALYGQRKATVETVFGIIKSAMGFRQFMLRGHANVSGEWTLVRIAYNLKRLFRLAVDEFGPFAGMLRCAFFKLRRKYERRSTLFAGKPSILSLSSG